MGSPLAQAAPGAHPRLTVVIPAYNVEAYVKAAIDSVIAQTVPAAEIVIVDDGSTDRTGQIVEELYGHLPNVVILHTRNQGLGMARNTGTEAATGDFIYYFDSDDMLGPDFFQHFYETWRKQPDLDLFCFSARSFFDEGVQAGTFPLEHFQRRFERLFPTGEDAFNFQFASGTYFPVAWLYIHRRSVSRGHGIEFLPIIHEDEEYTPRLLLASKVTYICDREFFFRRVRANSITTSRKSERNVRGYFHAVRAAQGLVETTGFKAETYRNLRRLRARMLATVMTAIRSSRIDLVTPELQTVPQAARRYAFTSPKLFLVLYLFPVFKAAKATKRLLRTVRGTG
jgi:glycosyltransferase involved in cell wall biosynthesis